MKRFRLVSVVQLTTFLAPYEHVLITHWLSFQVFREAYSIFKVCMCQHGDANSSTNWRYRRVLFNESAWECWGLKKTYILREIPKTRFMDSGLLYENDEEECVLWMRSAWQTLASLCLFTCIVYVSKYWVPIALLRKNKPIWLLYLGHAQIIKEFSASKMKLMLVAFLFHQWDN